MPDTFRYVQHVAFCAYSSFSAYTFITSIVDDKRYGRNVAAPLQAVEAASSSSFVQFRPEKHSEKEYAHLFEERSCELLINYGHIAGNGDRRTGEQLCGDRLHYLTSVPTKKDT